MSEISMTVYKEFLTMLLLCEETLKNATQSYRREANFASERH
ncbi:hypothetical protein CAEBREN_23686 [Caenorhabditis brenneri]|uniref:Uncharacterized protein n=1 Tax=Caenorhabditis brenneri TaxID=135651 RepID=G0NSV7_CAEBE|nr:hypothetical protein CAEBREN_23686 [Caenorhabditis brenneri]